MTAANGSTAPFQLAARRAWHRDLTGADFHAIGVGVPTSLGLAFGALDAYGPGRAPRVHILDGESQLHAVLDYAASMEGKR